MKTKDTYLVIFLREVGYAVNLTYPFDEIVRKHRKVENGHEANRKQCQL